MATAKPIPFRKRKPAAGPFVRPTARIIHASQVELAGEVLVVPARRPRTISRAA